MERILGICMWCEARPGIKLVGMYGNPDPLAPHDAPVGWHDAPACQPCIDDKGDECALTMKHRNGGGIWRTVIVDGKPTIVYKR